jgi:hypothetical protein
LNETSGLITGEQVRNLPLNGRSYDELITLNPGSLNYTSQRTGGVGTSNSAVGNMFAISGRRPQENLFLLDGVEYTGASGLNQTPGGTSGLLLGVDSLREFNVLTNTYSAAYGKRPGAQVLLVANSGSTRFHGSAYEYLRNSVMDARNFSIRERFPSFSFRKRFSHGLDFRAVYTWAKSLDDGDSLNASGADNAPGLAEDARNLRLDWGRSTFDVRNAAFINALYELPFGAGQRFLAHTRGAEGIFVNNWTFGSIFSYQSGYPLATRAAIRSRRS